VVFVVPMSLCCVCVVSFTWVAGEAIGVGHRAAAFCMKPAMNQVLVGEQEF
jgi:hypothetical protein